MNNRKLVLSLYRSKVRMCCKFGYDLGKWDNSNLYIYRRDLTIKSMKRKNKNIIGSYIMNNVRYKYKLYKDEYDPIVIEDLIDDGFKNLRKINEYYYKTHYKTYY